MKFTITALPFADTVNTADATTETDDPLHDETCGFEPIDGFTVWYNFTPSANMRVAVSGTRSMGYDPAIAVYTGTPGNLTCVVSGVLPSLARFDAGAGTTYHIVAGSPEFDDGATLVLNVVQSLEVGVALDPVGVVDPTTGVAIITGTVSCSRSSFFELGGDVNQGRGVVSPGGLFASSDCDDVTRWEAEVIAESGRLHPGNATVSVSALFTDDLTTEEVHGKAETTRVRLVPAAAAARFATQRLQR